MHLLSSKAKRPNLEFKTWHKQLLGSLPGSLALFTIFYRVYYRLLYIENDGEIFPAHYTWEVFDRHFWAGVGFLFQCPILD
jgi:hypothetical protein